MAKKRPFISLILLLLGFAAIAFIGSGDITGLAVYENFSSTFSKNTLSVIGPTTIFLIIFSVSIVALRRITKD